MLLTQIYQKIVRYACLNYTLPKLGMTITITDHNGLQTDYNPDPDPDPSLDPLPSGTVLCGKQSYRPKLARFL